MWYPGCPGVHQDMATAQGLGARTAERQCLFLRTVGLECTQSLPSALGSLAHCRNGDQGSFWSQFSIDCKAFPPASHLIPQEGRLSQSWGQQWPPKPPESSKWWWGDESMRSKFIVIYIYNVSRFTLGIWKDGINIQRYTMDIGPF